MLLCFTLLQVYSQAAEERQALKNQSGLFLIFFALFGLGIILVVVSLSGQFQIERKP